MTSRRHFLFGSALLAGSLTGFFPSKGLGNTKNRLLLKRPILLDGTGAAPKEVDVLLEGDRILATGWNLPSTGAQEINLKGHCLAPGFIDIHSHTDLSLLVDPRAASKLTQGVTLEVAGQDGSSIGPWDKHSYENRRKYYKGRYDIDIDFRNLGGFFEQLERTPGSLNLASMIGAGAVREYVMGNENRPATDRELMQMVNEVRQGLKAGACGLSTGLEYIPGAFADINELTALAAPLRERGLPYASHMRNEDDRVLAAVEEALQVGRMAKVPVQISHLKAQGERNWWKMDSVLHSLEKARKEGMDVHFDRYPYVAYSTSLTALFPIWSRDGGNGELIKRLGDEKLVGKIENEVKAKIDLLGSWNAVQITSVSREDLKGIQGGRLGDLARDRNQDPYAFLRWLIVEDKGRTDMVGFGMSEENTKKLLAHPLGMICSDGGARATDGPYSKDSPHPRTFGSFPRVLGHYVREEKIMPLETAIHKMTGMPARKLGFRNRGVVTPGAFADLVVFDAGKVSDSASFEHPHQYANGIKDVMVNGQWVIREGQFTGARSGRVVKPG